MLWVTAERLAKHPTRSFNFTLLPKPAALLKEML
jgi:hypothetical protein